MIAEDYQSHIENLEIRRKSVIREIELHWPGSSDLILPDLFFKDLYEVESDKILLLEVMIDMFRIGYGLRNK